MKVRKKTAEVSCEENEKGKWKMKELAERDRETDRE